MRREGVEREHEAKRGTGMAERRGVWGRCDGGRMRERAVTTGRADTGVRRRVRSAAAAATAGAAGDGGDDGVTGRGVFVDTGDARVGERGVGVGWWAVGAAGACGRGLGAGEMDSRATRMDMDSGTLGMM